MIRWFDNSTLNTVVAFLVILTIIGWPLITYFVR